MHCYPLRPLNAGPIVKVEPRGDGVVYVTYMADPDHETVVPVAGPVPETEMPRVGQVFVDAAHVTDWMDEAEFRKHYEYV